MLYHGKFLKQTFFDQGFCFFIDFPDFSLKQSIDWHVIGESYVSSTIFKKAQCWMSLTEDYSISPCRYSEISRSVIISCTNVILICGVKIKLSFLTCFQNLVPHSVHVKLIMLTKLTVLLLCNKLLCFFTAYFITKSKVEIPLENSNVMILDLVVLVLSSSFSFEAIIIDILNLLMSCLDLRLPNSSF